jgi:hypothetical protein
MRIYLPATTNSLRELVVGGHFGLPPITGFAVTAGMREWYADADIEQLEYAAMLEAARASLRLLDSEPDAARLRAVVAADVADAVVSTHDDIDRGVVHVSTPVALSQVAAVHIDLAEASATIAAAAAAIVRADLGDPAAQDTVDDADGFDLAWYATQEVAALLGFE